MQPHRVRLRNLPVIAQFFRTAATAVAVMRARSARRDLRHALLWVSVFSSTLRAELRVPAIFSDHMVLQQGQINPVWGWDTPGTSVKIAFGQQSLQATAGADGRWSAKLAPEMPAAAPRTLRISGTNVREIHDVLVGEVWLCSGQSNMAATLRTIYSGDIEAAAATDNDVRLLSVPNRASQKPEQDFNGAWVISSPETAAKFSAVGYLFGSHLSRILGVPVGMIDNSWPSASAEAWIRRSTLEQDPRFRRVMAQLAATEAHMQTQEAWREYEVTIAKWETAAAAAKPENDRDPPFKPKSPEQWLAWSQRPGNLFGGVLSPIVGYGIRGVLWYQGESNVTRATEYDVMFPFLIEQWRAEWGQGNFPFYWVQLAAYGQGESSVGKSDLARLREAQTRTLKLPNTGQAVIIDRGEGRDIHPRRKYDVAMRLLRWALAKDYGMQLPYRSPEYQSHSIWAGTITVTFDCFGSRLRTFETEKVVGFTVCGEDRKWHAAEGMIRNGNQVALSCPDVPAPIAVRYAWADNPTCNLYSKDGLPATPFRTDDF